MHKLLCLPPALQVLEILSHVNKRIKALPALQLPLHELVASYTSAQSGPMARNFALVYVENAAGRAPPEARFAQVRRQRQLEGYSYYGRCFKGGEPIVGLSWVGYKEDVGHLRQPHLCRCC